MQRPLRRKDLDSRFITITAVLCALLGAPAFYSLLKDPQKNTVIATIQTDRSPASISDESIQGLQLSSNATLEIPCKVENLEREVQASYLRLKGTACTPKKLKQMTIVNQTNGFTAEVVFLPGQSFTTDFIDLQSGKNILHVESIDDEGIKSVQTITVNKNDQRLPASNQ